MKQMEARMRFVLVTNQDGQFVDINMDLVFKIEQFNSGCSIWFVGGERMWVKEHADKLTEERRKHDFVEFTRKQGGLIVLNASQIYSAEILPEDTVQLTMLNGTQYQVDESYDSVCEMLLASETCG